MRADNLKVFGDFTWHSAPPGSYPQASRLGIGMCSAGLPGCVEFNASTVALRFEYLRTEPAVQEVDVWCNIPADFWWPHLRDFLSDSWPSARVIKSDDVGGWSSFGSGNFGKWGGDEFGLPRYTLAQPAPSR